MTLFHDVAYRLLPKKPWADKFLHYKGFVDSQGRPPSRRNGGMNDAIYYLMTGKESENPNRHLVTDKEFVKCFVRARIGDKYNVPTVRMFHSLRDIRDFDKHHRFEPNCVLKPTHLSARVMFTPPHGEIDFAEIEDWFATSYYKWTREPFYKRLPPKVIMEPLLFGTTNISDYKIMCVNGEPRIIWVDTDRRIDHKRTFYTPHWRKLPVAATYPLGPDVPRPENLDEMLYIAACLAQDFNMIRIDLYSNGKECYVGEMTNTSEAGRSLFLQGEALTTHLLFGSEGIQKVLSNEYPKSIHTGEQVMPPPTPERIREFALRNFRLTPTSETEIISEHPSSAGLEKLSQPLQELLT